MNLENLGWDSVRESEFAQHRSAGLMPARVSAEHREAFELMAEAGSVPAEISGRMRHVATSRGDLPAVGDWVAAARSPTGGAALIHALLPRRGCICRKQAGRTTDEQILAANVDVALIVAGLDAGLNLNRIERYLAAAWDSGARPVILLNKMDLCDDVAGQRVEAESVALGVPVYPISAATGDGLQCLADELPPGHTAVLLGPSGVGKSTLVNALLGQPSQLTGAVRADDRRGRHTTTGRQMLVLPSGAVLIDTPGLRELHLWGDERSLGSGFADIESIAVECRFRDCTHVSEPGCAVRLALDGGRLDARRWENYLKLRRELRHLELQQDHLARKREVAKWKHIQLSMRKNKRKW